MSRLTLDYGVHWDLYTPLTERARRTSTVVTANGAQQYVINPQPGYQTNWKAWQPRVQISWQVTPKLLARAGAGVMTIPPNLWQDNFLTGSTPFAVYPRLVAAAGAPIHYGFQITFLRSFRLSTRRRAQTSLPLDPKNRPGQHGDGCEPLRTGPGRTNSRRPGERSDPQRDRSVVWQRHALYVDGGG
jgi:hypothetical protein